MPHEQFCELDGTQAGEFSPRSLARRRSRPFRFSQQSDGSIIFSLPIPSNTILSLLNTSKDFGTFARLAIESPESGAGGNVLACAEELTLDEVVQQWNEGEYVPLPHNCC